MPGSTLLDKVWAQHVVTELGGGFDLLHIDRHFLHDGNGARGLGYIADKGCKVRNPELVFATPDHAVSSAPGRTGETNPVGGKLLRDLRQRTAETGVQLFDLGMEGQGIVHVVGPEMGLTVPGASIVCGDSHTCTHGGLGALAFGIGSTELNHVLATQTLPQRKPKRLRVRFEGIPQAAVTPKDYFLYLVGRLGAAAGTGHAIEYAGSAVRALGVEGRMTICNLSIEMGAKIGMVAPDDATFGYLANRPYAPKGVLWDAAVAHWRTLPTDDDAAFDADHFIDVSAISPQVTWGTSPQDVISITERIPDPADAPPGRRESMEQALDYMGLQPGVPIEGLPVDWVFVGSCTNSRISDLREAAAIAKGRKVAWGVTAWVVPGSEIVKRTAEAEGLDRIFRDAGFQWREPGCSMCVAANGERVPARQRSVSTSNRNFVGRQGPNARTHLASPAMAVAAAVTGRITDVRKLGA
ncbi:3-isopropylmalate dehydratase large subunit [Bradyrhizobium sp. INPA03-11B]|uniref:3-isopropylmalate dehydratase large subunit n=1 Tax=Bradyrhizobium sp. INPA03-11B TaxID=418598 RepID=UPI00338FACDE